MTTVYCHPDPDMLPAIDDEVIPVLLYDAISRDEAAFIGNAVVPAIRRLPAAASTLAFDFLSIALAVTAADTFVSRDRAPDRWCRRLEVSVALHDPAAWQPHIPTLELALGFLSGDRWTIDIEGDGLAPPEPSSRHTIRSIDLDDGIDCVSLFSGGLDSTIGVLDLVEQGRRPLLVSHAYNRDSTIQDVVLQQLALGLPRLAINLYPGNIQGKTNDNTMRARSFNFLALGIVAASALQQITQATSVDLIVPENGFIAINPPLTPRRVGALSTRTTHPYFLALVQRILDSMGMGVRITNPYEFRTKGEIFARCLAPTAIRSVASQTMSCSNWKRKGKACGRCVPCLIRRASFQVAGVTDNSLYETPILQWGGLGKKLDDLLAVTSSIKRAAASPDRPLAVRGGPLPNDPATRAGYDSVVRRGLQEVAQFLGLRGLL